MTRFFVNVTNINVVILLQSTFKRYVYVSISKVKPGFHITLINVKLLSTGAHGD